MTETSVECGWARRKQYRVMGEWEDCTSVLLASTEYEARAFERRMLAMGAGRVTVERVGK